MFDGAALLESCAVPKSRLFLTATSILFVELLLIRWIPANVIYVGFFRNFLLMAAFLGIGVGILWGRDPNAYPGLAVRAVAAGAGPPRDPVPRHDPAHLDPARSSSAWPRAPAPTSISLCCRRWSCSRQ